jgi:uncharacterized protein (UPF0332 family)
MDVKKCFEERILIKIKPDLEKTKQSIKKAEEKLERAKELFSKDFFNEALFSAYTSFFHMARALLYKEGVQEKSHYAIYIYIKEKYFKEIDSKLTESFRFYQLERHNILYGFSEETTKEEAENSILDAEEFIGQVKRILEKK